MGPCPQLQSLHHSAENATAAHLGQYVMLQSLSNRIIHEPAQCSLVEGLTPLTRLQHLYLTKCVPSSAPFGYNHKLCKCSSCKHVLTPQRLHLPNS